MDKLKELQEPFVDSVDRLNETSAQHTLDHVRLPQIKLQTFSGNIDEWMSFRDLYTSLIHWKTDLPDVEKFHYLKGCLQGEPKSLIDSLQITRANYQVAWDLLVKRYNNSKLLKKKQVQALFKLPQLSRESPSELHCLVEEFHKAVQILDQVVQAADYKDLLLVHLLTSRLDPVTRRSWEEHSASEEQETINQLMDFLQKKVTVLESLPVKSAESKFVHQHLSKPRLPFVKTSYGSFQTSGSNCPMCSAGHFLHECADFKKLNATERDSVLLKQALCRNCLRAGHQSRDCKSKFSCRNCKGRHHTLVCFRYGNGNTASTSNLNHRNNGNTVNAANVESDELEHVTSASASGVKRPSTVLLATAVVWLEDEHGVKVPARALLDSGSECNFATERVSQLINASRKKVSVTVQGIGQSNSQVKQQIQAKIRSRISDFTLMADFLVLPKVTANLPTQPVDISGWKMPQEITLADPAFFKCRSVDLVLGIESFFSFFKSGREISLGNNLPTLIESVFGWVICGGQSLSKTSDQITCNVSVSETIEEMVSRFWLSEEIDVGPSFSPEEARCEEIFKQDVQRSEDGRYVVSLPKNESVIQRLGESKRIAIDRLKGTERRLARNPALHEEYHKFMNEYIELGHMQKVEERDSKKRCFLPHHPVLKEASTTTKVRVVFDASCKTSSGISLNDALLLGPTIQQDLRSIILRSRTKQILIVSDVEKMFRQVYVRKEDRPLHCILWRSSPEKEIDVYEMNAVTYGTKPAPFLATRALKQLAMDEKEHYSRAAQVLQTDVYMDDVITGADSKEEAIMLRQELDAIMKSGGFLLRKWASNCPEVLDGISEENLAIKESEEILLDPDPTVTTLGLVWRPKSDILKLKFQIPRLELTEQLTKRKILSVIASLFDPLGLVGAAITTAKIFLQLLWTYEDSNGKKLDWDSPLPKMVGEEWWKFYKQLPLLQEISIGRCLIIPKAVSVEIHCFSDASVKAFGTCAYVKSKNAEGSVWIRLVSSKSKVAPLKCQSIPRLELCGALMAAQLYQKLAESLQISCKVHFWTDSSCVLRWLESTPTTWTTYVANRVSKIQIITEGHTWSHVAGIDNPADVISRGIYPESLLDSSLWWHGPSWLVMDSEFWPKPVVPLSSDVEKERCRKIVANVAAPFAEFNIWYISKHATYTELIRRTAYYLRVMELLKLPKEKRKGSEFLTTAELRHAEYILISRVQRETFPNEWKALSSGQVVACKSPLRWFNPYISPEDGIMRIGGRLNRSQELSDTKHQIILPANNLFTRKLLEHYHEKLMHAGPQLMLAVIRLKYWPLANGRSAPCSGNTV
ncbi:uncharacterized protein LOC129754023 [Uranotaenia lowii]|uniref:uncharacterized protein LOC129754023 n=1 Tax=Uranotaenia lowii TaxID=190385 RepID=UPI00247A8ACD|nr:uncharacterized protein LOC129754023 [Uranotaenia lowii]